MAKRATPISTTPSDKDATERLNGDPERTYDFFGKGGLFFGIELCLLVLVLVFLGFSQWKLIEANKKAQQEIEEFVKSEISLQTDLLREEFATVTDQVKEQILERAISEITTNRREISYAVGSGTNITGGRIRETNSKVDQLEAVFNAILEEQKKNTIESLYDDVYLADKMKEALGLMDQGQYKKANEAFLLVSNEQPDNLDAYFFVYYSLFLSNKQDRDQYRYIKEGFALLERNGYSRQEIDDVLAYIGVEESGTIPEGF